MKTLGAVLAGGESRRFGSDKALAVLDGQTLLERAVAALTPITDAVVVIGREQVGTRCVPDWPRPGMGPLGGLAGGLVFAEQLGFDQMLSVPVDCGPLPEDLLALLSPAPAFLKTLPVIGLWPVAAAATLRDLLQHAGNHAVRHFAEVVGARSVDGVAPANINTPDDLMREEAALRSEAPKQP